MGIDDDLLQKHKETLQKKMVYDNIIILNPSLKDLLNDNIFKLELELYSEIAININAMINITIATYNIVF